MRCNNRGDLLYLSFTLKISVPYLLERAPMLKERLPRISAPFLDVKYLMSAPPFSQKRRSFEK